jgi:hypothetical protein
MNKRGYASKQTIALTRKASRTMNLKTELYLQQADRWPSKGRVILAQYDEDSIVIRGNGF